MDIISLITSVFQFGTKLLPDDEKKLEEFKLRYPRRFQRIKQKMIDDASFYLRKKSDSSIDEYCAYMGYGEAFKNMLAGDRLLRKFTQKYRRQEYAAGLGAAQGGKTSQGLPSH